MNASDEDDFIRLVSDGVFLHGGGDSRDEMVLDKARAFFKAVCHKSNSTSQAILEHILKDSGKVVQTWQVLRLGGLASRCLPSQALYWAGSYDFYRSYRPHTILFEPVKTAAMMDAYKPKTKTLQGAINRVIRDVFTGFSKEVKNGEYLYGRRDHTLVVLMVEDETGSVEAHYGVWDSNMQTTFSLDEAPTIETLADFYLNHAMHLNRHEWKPAAYAGALASKVALDADWKMSSGGITARLSPDAIICLHGTTVSFDFMGKFFTEECLTVDNMCQWVQDVIIKCVGLVAHDLYLYDATPQEVGAFQAAVRLLPETIIEMATQEAIKDAKDQRDFFQREKDRHAKFLDSFPKSIARWDNVAALLSSNQAE